MTKFKKMDLMGLVDEELDELHSNWNLGPIELHLENDFRKRLGEFENHFLNPFWAV